jgi:dephospho-CoA kinase
MPFTVGLTGGIASGKTFIATLFAALGVPVTDADHAARVVVTPPSPVLDAIAERFGAEFIQADGGLDRRKLREKVFADPDALAQLESLTHPAIRQWLLDWRDQQTAPYCIIANAILLESKMDALVDRVLVIDVQESTQLARLVGRDNIPLALAEQMMKTQTSRDFRLSKAQDVIDNDAGDVSVVRQVEQLHAQYLSMAKELGK